MTAFPSSKSRVLAVGPTIGSLAAQAFPHAAIETLDGAALAAAPIAPDTLDLVLVETQAAGPGELARLLESLAGWRTSPAVILVGEHLPAALARALFRLERSDVLAWPMTADELARAAAALMAEIAAPPAPAGEHHSHCWTVMGAVGGSGGTTLTIELAATLADRNVGRVALFDLNLADGAASAYLGVTGAMRLAEAAATPERIDKALLEAFGLPSGSGFDLFSAERDPHAFSKVTPQAICRLLEVACETYDFILIDLPRLRQPWTADVLAGSDEVIVISELTVPALLSARALTSEIEAELDGRRARLVLNRMAARVFGPAPSRTEAEKALGRKVDGAITSDWEAAACSVNLGGAISHHRPRSKIVKDVVALVDTLAPMVTAPVKAAR